MGIAMWEIAKKKEVAVNALAETSSILVVVQKYCKGLSLECMSKLSSSRLLSFIEKTILVKISEYALPQLTKKILRNHLANVRRVKSIWPSWHHNKNKNIDSVGETRREEVILSKLENLEDIFDAQIQELFDRYMRNDRAARKEKLTLQARPIHHSLF